MHTLVNDYDYFVAINECTIFHKNLSHLVYYGFNEIILAATCTSVVTLVRSDTSTKSTNNFLNLSYFT